MKLRQQNKWFSSALPAAEKPLCCCLHSPEAVRRGARGARRVKALLIVLSGTKATLESLSTRRSPSNPKQSTQLAVPKQRQSSSSSPVVTRTATLQLRYIDGRLVITRAKSCSYNKPPRLLVVGLFVRRSRGRPEGPEVQSWW